MKQYKTDPFSRKTTGAYEFFMVCAIERLEALVEEIAALRAAIAAAESKEGRTV